MNQRERMRYSRQLLFPGVGEAGQAKLLAARVLLVGCGATGGVIASTLVRAGVGHLTLVDRDFVEWSNLPRQVLFDEADARQGLPKAIAAARKLAEANSTVAIEPHVTDVNAENVEELAQGTQLVLDGTDNFDTRYLINEVCVKLGRPWVYGGAVGATGMSLTIVPGQSACFRCVFPNPPAPGSLPTCDTAGIVAPAVNLVGSMVAAEALKLLVGSPKVNTALTCFDLWENSYELVQVDRRVNCPTCGRREFELLEGAREEVSTTLLCGKNAVQVRPGRGRTLDLSLVRERLSSLGNLQGNEYLIKFRSDPAAGGCELTIFADGRAIVQGTENELLAKSLYARYVGN